MTLALQQQALLEVLLSHGLNNATEKIAQYADVSWARGLKVYEANAKANAQSSLSAVYPVLTQLLGEDSMSAMARDFWCEQPPQRGDLSCWGGNLATFVRHNPQLSETPYLADVAVVEWLMHVAQSAENPVFDPASFALLTRHDPEDLCLQLAPGGAVFSSSWPVVSIVQAHLHVHLQAHLQAAVGHTPDLTQAGRDLCAGVAQQAVVWRQGFEVKLRQALPGEMALLEAILNGASLQQALSASPGLDFTEWLPMAAQTQLITGTTVRDAIQ